MGFSRPEYWCVLICPPLGDLPNPGINPMSLKSPALAGRLFTTSTIWEAHLKMSPLIFWYLGENNSWVSSVKFIPSYVFSPDKHKQCRKWNVCVCVFLAENIKSGKKSEWRFIKIDGAYQNTYDNGDIVVQLKSSVPCDTIPYIKQRISCENGL